MWLLRGPLGCYRIFVASLDEVAVIALRMAATTGHKQTGHKLKLIHTGVWNFFNPVFYTSTTFGGK